MKKLSYFLLLFVLFVSFAYAKDVRVKGYYRSDGTYVQPHYRTEPNRWRNDNYSYPGNINPYTRERGSGTSPKSLYPTNPSPYNNNYDRYHTNPYSKPYQRKLKLPSLDSLDLND